MKTKHLILIAFCFIAAAFFLGYSGLISFAGESSAATNGRLVGVLITQSPLDEPDSRLFFDAEAPAFAAELLSQRKELPGGNGFRVQDPEQYTDPYRRDTAAASRFYAELTDADETAEDGTVIHVQEYVFPKIDGLRFFCPTIRSEGEEPYKYFFADDGLSDLHQDIHVSDEGEILSLEGTVYLNANTEKELVLYPNPVYQTEAGELYALSAETGLMVRTNAANADYALTHSISIREDISSDSSTSGTEIKLNFRSLRMPNQIRLLQFDDDHVLLKSEEYQPGALPARLSPEPEAAFLLVEELSSGEARRSLFQKTDDRLYAFDSSDGLFCTKKYCDISWSK